MLCLAQFSGALEPLVTHDLIGINSNGDLLMTMDFRCVYATMIKEWMGFEHTETLLKGDFPPLGLFV